MMYAILYSEFRLVRPNIPITLQAGPLTDSQNPAYPVRVLPRFARRKTEMVETETKPVEKQGNVLVVRDAKGEVVASANVAKAPTKESWRRALAKLTNNGKDLDEILLSLAHGVPYEPTLPDGRKAEPIIPTPEVRRAAAMNLLENLRGKAVAQTEVLAAEKADEDLVQYAALSDAQLLEAARPWLERKQAKSLPEGISDAEYSPSDGE